MKPTGQLWSSLNLLFVQMDKQSKGSDYPRSKTSPVPFPLPLCHPFLWSSDRNQTFCYHRNPSLSCSNELSLAPIMQSFPQTIFFLGLEGLSPTPCPFSCCCCWQNLPQRRKHPSYLIWSSLGISPSQTFINTTTRWMDVIHRGHHPAGISLLQDHFFSTLCRFPLWPEMIFASTTPYPLYPRPTNGQELFLWENLQIPNC